MTTSYSPTAEFTASATVLVDGDAASATNLNPLYDSVSVLLHISITDWAPPFQTLSESILSRTTKLVIANGGPEHQVI